MEPLLHIKNLHAGFVLDDEYIPALRGVNIEVMPGEVVALVGESGSGKTLSALSVLRLLEPPALIQSGEILYRGKNLLKFSEEEINQVRGKKISMIFQEPMVALNPVFKIGTQIAEVLVTHQNLSWKEAWSRSVELLRYVKIPDPEQRAHSYPFEFSGGMRQRAMIAMAIALSPALLIADEPTTALDVTIQKQILGLIREMAEKNNMAVLLITHDLGIVREYAQKTVIIYAGEIVESGPTEVVLGEKSHPYTEGLINCLPVIDEKTGEKKPLKPIRGIIPSLKDIPGGCVFRNRCDYQEERCMDDIPEKISQGHLYRCIR